MERYKAINLFSLVFVYALLSLISCAFAQATQTTIPVAQSKQNPNTSDPINSAPPATLQGCNDVIQACRSAGYTENGPKRLPDCLNSLLQGKSIPNITINSTQISACNNELAQQPCNKILTQCHQAGYVGGFQKLPMFDCLIPLATGRITPGSGINPEDLAACKKDFQSNLGKDPCLQVMIACKTAGYSPDAVNGAIFVRNCYGPIIGGKQVLGVVIDPAVAAACGKVSASPTKKLP